MPCIQYLHNHQHLTHLAVNHLPPCRHQHTHARTHTVINIAQQIFTVLYVLPWVNQITSRDKTPYTPVTDLKSIPQGQTEISDKACLQGSIQRQGLGFYLLEVKGII